MVRLVLIDDDPRFSASMLEELKHVKTVEVVGAFGCYEGAQAKLPELRPDVVLMDLRLGFGVMDGVAATKMMKKDFPRVRVLVFSGDQERMNDALAAGADGALDKLESRPHESLCEAIQTVYEGRFYLGERAGVRLREFLHRRGTLFSALSPMENVIMTLREQGMSYKELADRLQISVHTAKTHARRIKEKSLATHMQEAVSFRKLGI